MYAVRAGRLPQDLDYVALGHVHRAQRVPGLAAPGRYAGSPLALDFSEDAARSVAVVDLDGDGASVRELALHAGRSLARIRGPLDALSDLAAEHPGAFLFCEVELERPVLDLVREVRERVPRALRVEPRYAAAGSDGAEGGAGGDAPRSLVEHYADWHEETGRPLDRGVVAAFEGAIRAAEPG